MKLIEIEYVPEDKQLGWLPYYIYDMEVNNEVVGRLVLRLGDDTVNYYSGHVGYSVEPMYQGHNYSYQAMLALKPIAIEKGFDHLLITCDPSNIASKKTIQKIATYIETKEIPKQYKKDFSKEELVKEIYCMKLIEL